jgi:hypothetical protein
MVIEMPLRKENRSVYELQLHFCSCGSPMLVIDAQRIAHLMEQAGDGDADGLADGHHEEASQKLTANPAEITG